MSNTMVLYIESILDQHRRDLSKWDLYYADALKSLDITKAVDYTDLFIEKKDSPSNINN